MSRVTINKNDTSPGKGQEYPIDWAAGTDFGYGTRNWNLSVPNNTYNLMQTVEYSERHKDVYHFSEGWPGWIKRALYGITTTEENRTTLVNNLEDHIPKWAILPTDDDVIESPCIGLTDIGGTLSFYTKVARATYKNRRNNKAVLDDIDKIYCYTWNGTTFTETWNKDILDINANNPNLAAESDRGTTENPGYYNLSTDGSYLFGDIQDIYGREALFALNTSDGSTAWICHGKAEFDAAVGESPSWFGASLFNNRSIIVDNYLLVADYGVTQDYYKFDLSLGSTPSATYVEKVTIANSTSWPTPDDYGIANILSRFNTSYSTRVVGLSGSRALLHRQGAYPIIIDPVNNTDLYLSSSDADPASGSMTNIDSSGNFYHIDQSAGAWSKFDSSGTKIGSSVSTPTPTISANFSNINNYPDVFNNLTLLDGDKLRYAYNVSGDFWFYEAGEDYATNYRDVAPESGVFPADGEQWYPSQSGSEGGIQTAEILTDTISSESNPIIGSYDFYQQVPSYNVTTFNGLHYVDIYVSSSEGTKPSDEFLKGVIYFDDLSDAIKFINKHPAPGDGPAFNQNTAAPDAIGFRVWLEGGRHGGKPGTGQAETSTYYYNGALRGISREIIIAPSNRGLDDWDSGTCWPILDGLRIFQCANVRLENIQLTGDMYIVDSHVQLKEYVGGFIGYSEASFNFPLDFIQTGYRGEDGTTHGTSAIPSLYIYGSTVWSRPGTEGVWNNIQTGRGCHLSMDNCYWQFQSSSPWYSDGSGKYYIEDMRFTSPSLSANTFRVYNAADIYIGYLSFGGSYFGCPDENDTVVDYANSTNNLFTIDPASRVRIGKFIDFPGVALNYLNFRVRVYSQATGINEYYTITDRNIPYDCFHIHSFEIDPNIVTKPGSNVSEVLTDKVEINNGTSSQFLKADGSLDSSRYLQASDLPGVNLNLQTSTDSTVADARTTLGSYFTLTDGGAA